MAGKKKVAVKRKTTSKTTGKAKSSRKIKATAGKSKTKTKTKTKTKAKAKSRAKTSTKLKAVTTTKVAKPKLGTKPYNKSELLLAISADTGLTRGNVKGVLDSLEGIIGEHLVKTPKSFNLHGICKMLVKTKPATKARKGINPFTGEEMMFKAKPASKVVRIRPFKKLKSAIS